MATTNAELLEKIKSRQTKQTAFNEGILTADRYVRTLQECVGPELCKRYAPKTADFDSVVKAAQGTLTYSNSDMVFEETVPDYKRTDTDGDELELPKNTLMVFKHVLTTPRKDRDGDILHTKGAKVDPKMLLLWQHVHTLPIGKMLGVTGHNPKKLTVVSAIVDINELAHDAVVMIDNKMGRFSHGFRALEFMTIKASADSPTGDDSFEVTSFEIMEESLVSVPSNVDAEVDEILLSLVEGDKLTSSIMKGVGKRIREKRTSVSTKVGVDVKAMKVAATKSFHGGLSGSYEDLIGAIQNTAHAFFRAGGVDVAEDVFGYPYVSLLATFDGYAVFVHRSDSKEAFYKANWEMVAGEPQLVGVPVEVEISTTFSEKVAKLIEKATNGRPRPKGKQGCGCAGAGKEGGCGCDGAGSPKKTDDDSSPSEGADDKEKSMKPSVFAKTLRETMGPRELLKSLGR